MKAELESLVNRLRAVMRVNEASAQKLDDLEWRILKKGDEAMSRLLKRMSAAVMLVLLCAGGAAAEMQGMYVNVGRGWTLVSTYINEDECDKAARRVWREGKVVGVGCARFTPERDVKQWNPPRDDGYRTKEQQRIDERNQVYENRRDRYEGQFYKATPR